MSERVMGYAVICKDKPGEEAGRLRKELTAEHLAHIADTIDNFLIAGPMLEAGETTSSLLIVKAQSEEEALEIVNADPYAKAGIWESIEVRTFVAAAGDWVGGTTW
ncbi:MAG: YciI family protein [Pseudomonadota bacterium]